MEAAELLLPQIDDDPAAALALASGVITLPWCWIHFTPSDLPRSLLRRNPEIEENKSTLVLSWPMEAGVESA